MNRYNQTTSREFLNKFKNDVLVTFCSQTCLCTTFTKSCVMSGNPEIRLRSLRGHYLRYLKSNDTENMILYAYKPDLWYALIRNLDEPYKGAEFLCTLEAGKNYPYGPPVVKFLTPNGTVKLNEAFCVDMGHYHSDNYPAELGMDGFTRQMSLMLVMGMKGLGGGINLLNSSDSEKKEFSANSVVYNNAKNKDYIDHIRKIEVMLHDYELCLKNKCEDRQKALEKIFMASKLTSAAAMLDEYNEYVVENPPPLLQNPLLEKVEPPLLKKAEQKVLEKVEPPLLKKAEQNPLLEKVEQKVLDKAKQKVSQKAEQKKVPEKEKKKYDSSESESSEKPKVDKKSKKDKKKSKKDESSSDSSDESSIEIPKKVQKKKVLKKAVAKAVSDSESEPPDSSDESSEKPKPKKYGKTKRSQL